MHATLFFKISLLWLLLLVTACTTAPTPQETPLPSPPASMAVLVRVQNQSEVDIESLRLTYPDKNNQQLQIPFLAAGDISAYFPLPEVYQSAAVEAMVAGQRYTLEALDLAAESPITSGTYRYTLNLQNNNLILSLEIESEGRESAIAPVVQALVGAGAPVRYELSVPRETIFDRLWGESVTHPELLMIDEQQVWLYRFADDATAQRAADAIMPGGTQFILTHEDGTQSTEFMGTVAAKLVWWQWKEFVVLLGGFTPAKPVTVDRITQGLGVAPLHSDTLNGSEVQLRLANVSEVDFERLTLKVHPRQSDYGALPRGAVSGYQAQNGAYVYAEVHAFTPEQEYQFIPIDFMGEAQLEPGNYTYALDVTADGQVIIAHLPDDVAFSDPALFGKWYWSNTQQADGTFITPESDTNEQPYLEFSATPDANAVGFTVTGHGGCNALFAAYRISPRHAIVTNGVGSTAVGCTPLVLESETFLQSVLAGILYYQIEGDTLSLYIPSGGTMTFVRP